MAVTNPNDNFRVPALFSGDSHVKTGSLVLFFIPPWMRTSRPSTYDHEVLILWPREKKMTVFSLSFPGLRKPIENFDLLSLCTEDPPFPHPSMTGESRNSQDPQHNAHTNAILTT